MCSSQLDEYRVADILETLRTSLSPAEYELAQKYFLYGISEKELASEMNTTTNAIRIRIYKLRNKLSRILLMLMLIMELKNGKS